MLTARLLPLLAGAALASAFALPTATINGDLYTATPAGYVLSHCVHEVPSGARIGWHADGVRRTVTNPSSELDAPRVLPLCLPRVDASNPVLRARDESESEAKSEAEAATRGLPANYDGWLQYTVANTSAPTGYTGFYGEMSVPDVPKKRPQQLFLFPGLQNIVRVEPFAIPHSCPPQVCVLFVRAVHQLLILLLLVKLSSSASSCVSCPADSSRPLAQDWIPKVDPEPKASNPFDIIQPVLQVRLLRPGWSHPGGATPTWCQFSCLEKCGASASNAPSGSST